jgi:phosphoribosylanthranilate isomerase
MSLKLKVCGMRDPENLEQLVSLGPDYIGFIFYGPSKRFVGDLDPELTKQIPAGIKATGVFVDESLEEVVRLSQRYDLKALQLHGKESPEYCMFLKQHLSDIEVIKAFGVNDQFTFGVLEAYRAVVDYFLFDTQTADHGGSGKTFDWTLLQNYQLQVPYFLSGGIGLEELQMIKAIADPRLHAVDVNSRFETAPAMKNIELLTTFKNQL